jgi:putative transposase
MLKAFRYRIMPTATQAELINKHIGCTRFVYNNALQFKQFEYAKDKINHSCFALHKRLTTLKKEYDWLKEVNSQSLQQAITNLDKAYTAFFKEQNNFPKFKKKGKGKQSFNIPQSIKFNNDKLIIPKFKRGINIVLHRPVKGEIRQATISRTPTGKYFVSILCETGEAEKQTNPVNKSTTVGLDLGIKSFFVASNGKECDNPKYLRKSIIRLKYQQRQFSKHKSNKRKHRLAILHEKVANQRKDFLHKVSSELIRDNQSIALEDLNISGMLKNHCLAGSIFDVSWGMFVTMLEYKARWNGVNILRIGRFEPSSKTCSKCGYINKELTLKDREWTCPDCGSVLDRDLNASINIKNFALNKLCTEHTLKNHGMLPSIEGTLTHEVHPIGFDMGGQFTTHFVVNRKCKIKDFHAKKTYH